MINKPELACGLLCGLLAWMLALNSEAAALPDVLAQPSSLAPQSARAVLLDVTRAGSRLVAVGERGVVLLSDDNGRSWHQVQVPVSSSLTAVQFVDDHNGWAIGHSGVVLHSSDGGQSWNLQLDGRQAAQLELVAAQLAANETSGDPAQRLRAAQRLVADGADKPFLALSFDDARHGVIVGAYGLAMRTDDGGEHWSSLMDRIPNAQGLHFYALARSGQTLYVAGEQGLLLRSLDNGEHFTRLASPYEGSYFSLTVQPDGALLAGGLRGKAFRSRDQGETFEALTNPAPISLGSATHMGTHTIWVNQAGELLRVEDDSLALRPMVTRAGPPLNAVVDAPDGTLIGAGFAGVSRLSVPAVSPSPIQSAHAALEQ
jgi:photosystem II stability/assembly factor-like uncharacterized protein